MLGPVNSRNPDAMLALRMDMMSVGVFLNGRARDQLWPRLSNALKTNNPETHRVLQGDDIPKPAALRGMTYYPEVTASDYGGASPPSYEAWQDKGTNTVYVMESQGGLNGPKTTKWHALPAFEMPEASPRGFS